MAFLDRIQLLRTISGGAQADSLGSHPEGVSFFSERSSRFAIVSDPRVAKGLLNFRGSLAMSHLDVFLKDVPRDSIRYLLFFLNSSAEFLNGDAHETQYGIIKRIASRLVKITEAMDPLCLGSHLQRQAQKETKLSSSALSRLTLSTLLTRIGRVYLRNEEFDFRPTDITDEYGFFSAAPRVSRLVRLNADLSRHLREASIHESDDHKKLFLFTLRIMGASPLHGALTASLNELIERRSQGYKDTDKIPSHLSQDGSFRSFLPTRFVLRRMNQPFQLHGFEFMAGDVVFIYLAEASGCPIRKVLSFPFGAGIHYCPGAELSRKIIRLSLLSVLASGLTKRTSVSPVQEGSINAFLRFQ